MEDGLRPASCAWCLTVAAKSANRAGVPTGNRGLLPMGYQASASRPARRSATGLSPPTQMGGCGFCTGLGAKATLAKRQYVPANVGLSLVHSSLKARMYSSLTAPRLSYGGAPMASNSSRIQPTPQPTMSRPLESTSMVASILAVSTGGRCGTTMTEVSSRAVDVTPARKVRRVSCSRHSPDGLLTNEPLSLYGYVDAMAFGMMTWSL